MYEIFKYIDKTDINYLSNINNILFFAYNNTGFTGKNFIKLSSGMEARGVFLKMDFHLQNLIIPNI